MLELQERDGAILIQEVPFFSLGSKTQLGRLRLAEEMGFLESVKRKHVGKWIGVKGTDVLVVSDTHDDMLKQLRERHVDGAYVFYSPTKNEKEYGFLFLVYKWKLSRESSSAE
jgi:hypothetical protein